MEPAGFFEAIRAYQIIDGPIGAYAIWGLISLELIVATALVIPSLHNGAVVIAGAMLISFTIIGVSVELRGEYAFLVAVLVH